MSILKGDYRKIVTFIILLQLVFPLCNSQQDNNFRSMKYSARSVRGAASWQEDLHSRFSCLMKIDDLLAVSKAGLKLAPEIIKTEDKGSYLLKEVEINSTPSRRIKIVLTIPATEMNKLPAIVCIHGHGGQLYSVYQNDPLYKGFAADLASNGYITVATTVSQHNIFEENRTLMGERLWDLIRCIDYLESLPQVDKNNIGCAGLSLGGEMAMWLGAMDRRIKATVSSGFLTKMDQMEKGHCMCWKFPGLRELVDYSDIYSLIAPRHLLCQNGLKETPAGFTVSIARQALEEISLIYKDYGKPENVTLVAHPEGHVVDVPSLLEFFGKTLKEAKTGKGEK
jgi:hypothetical protein